MSESIAVSTATAPHGRAAVVIGASGGLGAALLTQLQQGGAYECVFGVGRMAAIHLDYADVSTISVAAQSLRAACDAASCDLRLLIVATGFLHGDAGQPERSWANLDADYLQQVFAINTIGPALVMKHFLPLLPKTGRCVAGFVSAKVGSIGDNTLGGWYGYRASKAALNQFVKTASIELTRRNRDSVCVALHPGTVATPLSAPFAKTGLNVRPAIEAAADLIGVLEAASPQDTGCLIDYHGVKLPY